MVIPSEKKATYFVIIKTFTSYLKMQLILLCLHNCWQTNNHQYQVLPIVINRRSKGPTGVHGLHFSTVQTCILVHLTICKHIHIYISKESMYFLSNIIFYYFLQKLFSGYPCLRRRSVFLFKQCELCLPACIF